MAAGSPLIVVDGTQDFSGGVDSIKVTTVASDSNPNGLQRNQLAWLANATVRDGGITPRFGQQPIGVVSNGSALFQDAIIYEPLFGNTYILALLGGHVWMIDPDFNFAPRDLSVQFGQFHPPNIAIAFMLQAEQFAIIQAGDFGLVNTPPGPTLPLFWDGNILRRSLGILGPNNVPAGITPFNELPAAGPMDYFKGQVWYAQGRTLSAGDVVVDQASGSLTPYNFRDSVLKVTENPVALGGDGFTVPTQSGNIRAVTHSGNLDATLGQGNLFAGTSRDIYSVQVPATRSAWIAANANNSPQMTVVQINNGMVNDRSVVRVNGDLYFQSLEPAIRSLAQAVRYFGQPGNTVISANEDRILEFNNRALMRFATGVQFGNRLLQAVLPKQLPQGVIHQAILPLDFVPISSFGRLLQPIWEGHWEGLQVLKLLSGDFGGRERCFAFHVNPFNGAIELWELTNGQRFDVQDKFGNGARVTMQIEFPALNWSKPFDLKELASAELWVDKLYGDVDFTLEYRPDGDVCWHFWQKWKECAPKSNCDPLVTPAGQTQGCYPLTTYRESFRSTMTLPRPPVECQATSGRPTSIAYQIQPRLTVKGWCRIRGLLLHATMRGRQLYDGIVCEINTRSTGNTLASTFPQPAPPVAKDTLGNPVTQDIFGDPTTGDQFGG